MGLDTASHRRIGLLLLLAGLVLYAGALGVGFVSDDVPLVNWAIHRRSLFHLPPEFTVQLLRPVTYATYRIEAFLWGAWAPGYHLTSVLLHILGAWLLYRLVDLLSGRRAIAAWSALLFLASSVHTEAVTTIFGRTEPVMTVALLGASYAWARFRLHGRRAWMIAAYALFATGLFAKEPALLYGGVLAVLEGWLTLRESHSASVSALRGFALRMTPFAITAAVYLAVRSTWFGSPLGTYAGFELEPLRMLKNSRWFLFRTVVPGTHFNQAVAVARLDVLALAVSAVGLGIVARRSRDAGLIVFATAGVALTLFAVLPLSISILTTESERFVYLPSAFAAVLTVLLLDQILRRPAWLAAAMSVLLFLHAVVLTHRNQQWAAAGAYVRTSIETMADEIKAHPEIDAVMLLNMADSANGMFLFRDAFFPAIEMYRPELIKGPTIWAIAAHRIPSVAHPVMVTQISPRAFTLVVRDGEMVRTVDSTLFYRITRQTPQSFDVEFTDAAHRWLVLYASGGTTHPAAVLNGPGLPLGAVDAPSPLLCSGASVPIRGWAFDTDGIESVTLERALTPDGASGWTAVAQATPDAPLSIIPGTVFSFPAADRMAWTAQIPCPATGPPAAASVLRAIGVDRTGVRAELGRLAVTRREP